MTPDGMRPDEYQTLLALKKAQMNADMEMWIIDTDGNRMIIATLYSVTECQELWHALAKIRYVEIDGFEVIRNGEIVYKGDYITDEC